jgi:hypothetical protein
LKIPKSHLLKKRNQNHTLSRFLSLYLYLHLLKSKRLDRLIEDLQKSIEHQREELMKLQMTLQKTSMSSVDS